MNTLANNISNKLLHNKFINNILGQITLAVISAVLLILSTSGFGLSFTVFFAFVPVLIALNSEKAKPIITGWIIGILYWTVCLSWMTITFGYFGGAPLYAAIALLLGVAISGGFLFFVPYTYLASKNVNPIPLAMTFVVLEALKGTLFFGGVPWLNLAQSQYQNLFIVQAVSFYGEYGLSFLIMLINLFLFYIIRDYKSKKNYFFLIIIVIIMIFPGIYRTILPITSDKYLNVVTIQPGYDQNIKWDNKHRLSIINDINNMINSINLKDYDLLVLPESSYPTSVTRTDFLYNFLKETSKTIPIIFGSDRIEFSNDDNSTISENNYSMYNTMFLLDNETLTHYDKRHLTPFGEYFPFENILQPVKEYFFGPARMFSPGTDANNLYSKKFTAAPVICFETAFSELIRPQVLDNANLFIFISNDTWFGKNQGKIQHFSVDTIRAVEYGKSVVRATQDGISGFIMPNGSVPVIEKEAIPKILSYKVPLIDKNTFYGTYGNIWIVIVLILFLYIYLKNKNSRKDKNQ